MARPRRARNQGTYRPWKVSAPALREACAVLQIRLPVQIRVLDPVEHTPFSEQRITRGLYRMLGGKRHRIELRPGLSIEQANKTLWHELAHAYQHERLIREFYAGQHKSERYSQTMRDFGDDQRFANYWNSEHEQEARSISDEFAPLLNLIYG